jgi:hypothetical protein
MSGAGGARVAYVLRRSRSGVQQLAARTRFTAVDRRLAALVQARDAPRVTLQRAVHGCTRITRPWAARGFALLILHCAALHSVYGVTLLYATLRHGASGGCRAGRAGCGAASGADWLRGERGGLGARGAGRTGRGSCRRCRGRCSWSSCGSSPCTRACARDDAQDAPLESRWRGHERRCQGGMRAGAV